MVACAFMDNLPFSFWLFLVVQEILSCSNRMLKRHMRSFEGIYQRLIEVSTSAPFSTPPSSKPHVIFRPL